MSGGSKSRRVVAPRTGRAHGLLITISIASLLWSVAFAQDAAAGSPKKRRLGFSFCSGVISHREDLLVPLGFHGPGFHLGGVYTWQTAKSLWDVRLKAGLGRLENRFSHEAWTIHQELRVTGVREIAESQAYGRFWAGMSIPFRMNNLFLASWDDAHLYWLTTHSLAAAARWEKPLSQGSRVQIRMDVPVIGWVSRPPTYQHEKQEPLNHWSYHFTRPNESLVFRTPDVYRALYMQAVVSRARGSSILNLGLDFEYDQCREPKKFYGIQTCLFVSYLWEVG